MPWIGVYEASMQRSRRSDKYLLISYVCFLMLAYLFYGVCFSVWDQLFFSGRPLAIGDTQNYYPYLEIVELFLIVFVRTRISILYFPKVVTILNVVYLFYVYCNFYPFSGLAVAALTFSSLTAFILFLLFFEQPATQWNPFAPHTPALNNPRQAYIPVPQSRFSLGFDLWSLFYAPVMRSAFSAEEQTEVGAEAEPIQFDFESRDENRGNAPAGEAPQPAQELPAV